MTSAAQPSRLKRATAIGTGIAIALFIASELSGVFGHRFWAHIFEWQASLLQAFIPPHNIGTPEQPLYEGTPVHLFAWYVGVALSVPLYITIAYAILRLIRFRAL